MKINKLKINSYGKLKDKEIILDDGINLIYGQNESGKSTLIHFIINLFYGNIKNKKGKEISDYEKYEPWNGEEFSGKINYELDNGSKYEVFRDFNKKNPKIFNSNMEDISNQFNIDKNKGNEFFYEQTKIDEELFLSTLAINQTEIKLENQEQNILIQKIANLAQTGEDSTSFKKVIDRINRRQLEEIGTDRTREKPINLIEKKLEELQKEKEELKNYENLQKEFEEKENNLNNKILTLKNVNNILKEIKVFKENEKIEIEKLKIKENINQQNEGKINYLEKEILEAKKNLKQIHKNKLEEKTKIRKINIAFLFLIIINILQFISIKNKYLNYIFISAIAIFLIFYLYIIIKNNKKDIIKKEDKMNSKIINLENEKMIIEDNKEDLRKQIYNIKDNLNNNNILEKQRIKNSYENYIENDKMNSLLEIEDLKNINYEIEKNLQEINDNTLKLHTLNLEKKNMSNRLENLSKIQEEIIDFNNKKKDLESFDFSMNLAKEVLKEAYEEMRKSVTPKFTQKLSTNISKITNQKYNNVIVNENEGLMVELENGDYVSANKLSIGTIDQLYLSLRLSMLDDLTEENVPILLDESFAFFDDERLENILIYLNEIFENRQIIIFTCTNREKDILEENNIFYNYLEL